MYNFNGGIEAEMFENKMTKKIAVTAILAAVAAVLSYLESLLPLTLLIPLPGLKLGLSNIALLAAVYRLGLAPSLAVVLVRCAVTALVTGSVTGFFYSLAGGLLSALAMWLISRSDRFSIFGVSAAGAAAHNTGQITASMVMLGSVYTIKYLPLLLLCSPVTGFLTALAARPVITSKYLTDKKRG